MRNLVLYSILVVFGTPTAGWAQSPEEFATELDRLTVEDARRSKVERAWDVESPRELKKVTPIMMLGRLKTIKRPITEYSFLTDTNKWITLEDVHKLAKLLKSKKPCLHARACWSSFGFHTKYSTEGFEAAHMIYGYIKGHYPVVLKGDAEDQQYVFQAVRNWLRLHKIDE